MLSKAGQMKALKAPFNARMAANDESMESEHGWPEDETAGSGSDLGSPFAGSLHPSRDESQSRHVGRIGDLNASPEPKLATKPYGSDDGQSPSQSKSRGERSAGSIVEPRIARSEHPGGSGLLSKGDPGSTQGVGHLTPARDERQAGLGARGRPIPGGYQTGAGAGPKK